MRSTCWACSCTQAPGHVTLVDAYRQAVAFTGRVVGASGDHPGRRCGGLDLISHQKFPGMGILLTSHVPVEHGNPDRGADALLRFLLSTVPGRQRPVMHREGCSRGGKALYYPSGRRRQLARRQEQCRRRKEQEAGCLPALVWPMLRCLSRGRGRHVQVAPPRPCGGRRQGGQHAGTGRLNQQVKELGMGSPACRRCGRGSSRVLQITHHGSRQTSLTSS